MGVNNFDFIVIRYLCTVRPFRKELETEKKLTYVHSLKSYKGLK